MGIEDYRRLCDRLRMKSQGLSTCYDHSALYLEDHTIHRFVDSLVQQPQPQQPITTLSLNISRIGKKHRNNHHHNHHPWMPDGFDRLLQYIQTSTTLSDIRLSGFDGCHDDNDSTTNTSTTTTNTTTNNTSPSLYHTMIVIHCIEAIENNPYIHRVGLYHVPMDYETLSRWIRRSKTIHHLSISHCTMIFKQQQMPSRSHHGSCSNSSVHDNDHIKVHSKMTMMTAFSLNKSLTSIRLLDLDDTVVVSILQQLKSNRILEKLDISLHHHNNNNNMLSIMNAIGQLVHGGEIIGSPSKLQHIILRNSKSLYGLESLVRHITTIDTKQHGIIVSPLQRLDIINCTIDTISASLLRTLFRNSNHTIRHVCFCDISIHDDDSTTALDDIFQGLCCSTTIQQITLHRVPLTDHDYQSLQHLIRTNKYLTHVQLDKNILTTIKAKSITGCIQNNNINHNHLQYIPTTTRPGMCNQFSKISGTMTSYTTV